MINEYYNSTAYDFDAFKDYFCAINGIEGDDINDVEDGEVWEFISDCSSDDYTTFLNALRQSEWNENECVVVGTLGLWRGERDIYPECFSCIEDAIHKCIDKMDDCIIKQVGGHLEVVGMHHDGCNNFEIHLLNSRGIAAADRIEYGSGNADLSNRCYHKAIRGFMITI